MTHASLFTGIGGFDLAAKKAGWTNIFQVEKDAWCRKLNRQNFPNCTQYNDIKQFDGTPYRGAIDVISGGFPCQPFSNSGKQLGSSDDRHLWPEMFRVIREIQPRWVVGENVRAFTTWSKGLVFEQTQADLEAAGYAVQPFVLPATAVNAPHERYRIFIVAHAAHVPSTRQRQYSRRVLPGFIRAINSPKGSDLVPAQSPTHTDAYRQQRQLFSHARERTEEGLTGGFLHDCWDAWTSEPPVLGMVDGLLPRVDRAKSRLRGIGNAIVWQLAWRIFDTINAYEELLVS